MATKYFETRGPVSPELHYVVPRTEELAAFIQRIKLGRYLVIFAPRQTGKTTFFRWALAELAAEDTTYFPIHLDFEAYKNCTPADFYAHLREDIFEEIEDVFQQRGSEPPDTLTQFLESATLPDHVAMLRFFRKLARLLGHPRIVLLIDEFDGIPPALVSDFLYALRRVYVSKRIEDRAPYSVGIVGVKNVTQLNYDRTISPFNIQEEFHLPNFTLAQVQELLGQYTAEVGQPFEPEVVETLHRQTGGQPFLVNRLAQLLTQELAIPKTEPIHLEHFGKAHATLVAEDNVHLNHLQWHVRRDPRTGSLLMKIAFSEVGIRFNMDDEIISELATYGIIAEGEDGMCEIVNPIYLYCILRTFAPRVNGLEMDDYPADTGGAVRGGV